MQYEVHWYLVYDSLNIGLRSSRKNDRIGARQKLSFFSTDLSSQNSINILVNSYKALSRQETCTQENCINCRTDTECFTAFGVAIDVRRFVSNPGYE